MLEGINAMQRLSELIEAKNSRICAVLDIDAKQFYSEEITYEYWVAYLQSIADVVPAVRITMQERKKIYWDIIEVAKVLGFFVIGEICEGEISYIIENRTKAIVDAIDAVIIDMNIYENLEEIEQFLKLLKENRKGAFINVRDHEEEKAKRWQLIRRAKERKRSSLREKFFELQHRIERNCYVEDGRPDYLMVGVAISKTEHFQIININTFSLISNYEEENISDILSIFDAKGLGAIITINFSKDFHVDDFSKENWSEIRARVIKKREEINNAINEYYGIE